MSATDIAKQVRTFLRPALRAARIMRLAFFPSQVRNLIAMGLFGSLFQRGDPFCFINRRHYLSRFFNLRQRVGSVLTHYQYEQRNFDDEYHNQVYGEDGLVLWQDKVDDVHACMRLISSGDYRGEGDVSVYLSVNGQYTGCISYTFVNAASFGLPHGAVMFVTRIQVNRGQELELFRRCYRHNSPQYFCLAAVAGIARANDARSIAVIQGEAQVNYHPRHDIGFRNSYCNLWSQFGARPVDRQACVLDVPLSPPPLSSVASKHRARAMERRRRWSAIAQEAEATVRTHRLRNVPSSRGTQIWLYFTCITSRLLFDFGQLA